ncbi:MAG: hypothetical protein MUE96_06955 [Bacteroidia bacterium]|nr:hypothetical protein [Bacteroidia bacterium]
MKWIEQLKNYIGRWQLAREVKTKRIKRKLIPFSQVEHIGIVYNAALKDDELLVSKYAQALRNEGKRVFMLGYVDLKQLPHTKKFMLNSEFFWREKLNGINLPIKGKIGQFLELEFDVLMSIYREPLLPMQAVAAYSNAKYRVGPHLEYGLDFFDLMVDTGTEKGLPFLIEQLDFYLRNIK